MADRSDKSNKGKMLVLMSGGVDSSTAAALLVREGYEVSGVYLKLWETSKDSPSAEGLSLLGDPCWAQEMRDAARVAAKLGIPFQVWDVTKDYKQRVLENFYAEYAAGRTPNPDVLCNSEIKFGVALERALAAGFDYVATGHYARVVKHESRDMRHESDKTHTSYLILHTSVDQDKDQSYFLWRLTQDQLARVMFPIGEYTKPQVRALAQGFGLHNWNKKDSQGVCFLGKIKLKDFLSPLRGGMPPLSGDQCAGSIVDVHGTLLGFHDGLAHFTIGQRHGVNISDGHGPYFVVEKDLASNTLIVANAKDEPKYRVAELRIKNEELRIKGELNCAARVRYRGQLVDVCVTPSATPMIHDSEFIIRFKEPQRAVAPGQSLVFYDGNRVIGGGVIDMVRLTQEICKVSKYAHVS